MRWASLATVRSALPITPDVNCPSRHPSDWLHVLFKLNKLASRVCIADPVLRGVEIARLWHARVRFPFVGLLM